MITLFWKRSLSHITKQRSLSTTLISNDRTPTSPNSDSYGALRYRSQPQF
ncbi:MAG: hypothetical protein PX483_07600 [Nostocales cyanobacterium LE14-WE4]|nr:hypothetical protein [Nostocales cyanobacterium LE14-WE4]